jgi:hypothetical protein
MTQLEQQEREAEKDAKELLLLLLLGGAVVFRSDVGRFYVNGKSVSITTIRKYLQRIERNLGRRLTKLTDDLEAQKITLAKWQREFERSITSAHILAGALAVGGINAAVRNDEIQARIASELKYADNFGDEVKDKKVSPARMKSRAKSYLIAATITYGILELQVRKLMGGYTECRRIRRASESCPGCVAYAYRWMPIGMIPPIGSLQCGGRCRCYLEYR